MWNLLFLHSWAKPRNFLMLEVNSLQHQRFWIHKKEIARLRIHIEKAVRHIKEYHFFDRVRPLILHVCGSVNQIWSVCCSLTNFKGPLFYKQLQKELRWTRTTWFLTSPYPPPPSTPLIKIVLDPKWPSNQQSSTLEGGEGSVAHCIVLICDNYAFAFIWNDHFFGKCLNLFATACLSHLPLLIFVAVDSMWSSISNFMVIFLASSLILLSCFLSAFYMPPIHWYLIVGYTLECLICKSL